MASGDVVTKDSTRVRRRLAPGDRRTELVEAALRLLRRGADEGNWVADVAAESGAAKGTFYVYFHSWDDMLATVRDRLIDGYNAPVVDALATSDDLDWWGVLESQCERFIDLTAEFRRHHALIFHSPLACWPTDHTRTAADVLAALIEHGVASGAFAPVDGRIAATLLFAAIHATADAVLDGADRSEWAAGWMALARDHLTPTAPARRLTAEAVMRTTSAGDQRIPRRRSQNSTRTRPRTD